MKHAEMGHGSIYHKIHAHLVKFRKKNQSTDLVKMHFFRKFKTHKIDILQCISFASQVESDVVTILISYTLQAFGRKLV